MKRKKGSKGSKDSGKELVVSFVLDETGSMQSCLDQTISGFNEYLTTLKQKAGKILFTLTKFNTDKTDIVCNCIPIKDVKELSLETYVPAACTPLYDAVGRAINALSGKLAAKQNVLFVIMTDGEENSSKEFTQKKVFDLVKEKEKEGWTFVFLGANQDAWASSAVLGISKGNTMGYDPAKMKGTMRGMATATLNFCSTEAIPTSSFYADTNYKVEDND